MMFFYFRPQNGILAAFCDGEAYGSSRGTEKGTFSEKESGKR